jgi:hypothetical protein
MFRRLAYVSRPRPNLPRTEIPRIVSVSRVRNAQDGIGGVLLFTGMDFVQLIEGEVLAVAALWSRIHADPRHRDIAALLDERADDRWFADWRVGFPSDAATINLIAAWRERECLRDDTERGQLRLLFANADAM